MSTCTGCTKCQHLPLFTQLSALVVKSGSLGRKREWEAWLQLHRHFGFWTPSPDPSIPSHSPPGSPPSWLKAGVWVERERGKHGSNCTVISDFIPSHYPPGSPPSWSKAGVWVERESGKHGFQCNVISDFGPHRSTLASLPTLHPALHPRGRKRESGSNERAGNMAPTAPLFWNSSLPTLHPALHPRGRKQESGSKERVGSMASSALSSRIFTAILAHTPPLPWSKARVPVSFFPPLWSQVKV
ncbi:hypothetical protein B0H11DRAFT_1931171 [Mycena galericulata]|nr:hypothetical protein B0H11DRAFT_1931171 [Mycena galericulata]